MQPLIAVTVGELINYESGEAWTPVMYGQSRTYIDAIVRAGGVPFIMPLIDDKAALKRLYDQCAGLLLSGGHDVDSPAPAKARWRLKVSTSPRRDKQERQLIKWALRDDKPILGICRGMQLLNVTLGGNLYQDIETELPTDTNHALNIDKKDVHHLAHRLEIAADSQLAAILGEHRVATNSLHHQAIRELGNGLVATAHAEDGLIEAIELPSKRFVIGVQSHPEALEAEAEQLWQKLFRAFVVSASEAG